jgi:hypothetical protein|uniref:Uncharacterized protein n=1 Tax=Oryza sativa subsp. japonica TaxID=39947 RepID=Q6ZGI9_ORYSJ|nr:hypothetical protein [Oryza sativa Japonica Group]BAD16943.1 hypothetical protein [Oryza sativa Japonica Group]
MISTSAADGREKRKQYTARNKLNHKIINFLKPKRPTGNWRRVASSRGGKRLIEAEDVRTGVVARVVPSPNHRRHHLSIIDRPRRAAAAAATAPVYPAAKALLTAAHDPVSTLSLSVSLLGSSGYLLVPLLHYAPLLT